MTVPAPEIPEPERVHLPEPVPLGVLVAEYAENLEPEVVP
jgi:hypothetical protein